MGGMTRPRRVFWNRVAIVAAVLTAILVLFTLPRSSMWTTSNVAPFGRGTAEFGLLKVLTVEFESAGPANVWSAGAKVTSWTVHWTQVAMSLALLTVLTGVTIVAARWDIRRGRLRKHCDECGFDLTGLLEARCPECGAGFEKSE
jgi:hypothetical protein